VTQTSLAELRAGLGTALASVEGLAVHETIGGVYTPPFAVVLIREIPSYRETFGRTGNIALPFSVMLFVARADDQVAQTNLDEFVDWVGEVSVPQALEADGTLGGVAESTYVDSFRLLGAEEVASYGYLGGEFTVTVRANRERT
jgi:hypothetical protein